MADARVAQAGVELFLQPAAAARVAQAGVELFLRLPSTDGLAIEVDLNGVWTDVTLDMLAQADVKYGIDGNGPADLIASTGVFQFQLDNSIRNSAGLIGYYSPQHANARSGWTYGIGCRLTLGTYIKHRGKIRIIDPEPGSHLSRRVNVISHDNIRDLSEADGRRVDIQIAQSEVDLIQAVLAALPTTSRPYATSYATSVDEYPYAFDNIGEGAKALSLIRDVAQSARGYVYVTGPGIFTYQSRAARAILTSSYTLSDTMAGLELPSSLDGAYNRVRCTIHPKDIDATSTHVLWAATNPQSVAPDSTTEIWVTYRDPDDPSIRIGATAQLAMVAYTDYVANEDPGGAGVDRTASVSVSATYYATTAKLTIVSSTSVETYLTTLQVRGARIRDLEPITKEHYVAATYGDRPFDLDMPYQDDDDVAYNAAIEIYETYSDPTSTAQAIEFYAETGDLMTQALAREPGDMITISETVTGASAIRAIIQSVALDIRPGPQIVCRWGLAPVSFLAGTWVLGETEDDKSDLGEGTILGF